MPSSEVSRPFLFTRQDLAQLSYHRVWKGHKADTWRQLRLATPGEGRTPSLMPTSVVSFSLRNEVAR